MFNRKCWKILDGCKTNSEIWSKIKLSGNIPSGVSVSTISSFRRIEISMMNAEVKLCEKAFWVFSKRANYENRKKRGKKEG